MNELTVIARNTEEMAVAQRDLIAWAESKQVQSRSEKLEIEENLAIAEKNKWRTSGLKLAVRMAQRQHDFYRKIMLALKAGYIIVPNFPIDVFAIRTNMVKPLPKHDSHHWDDSHTQKSELLPEGEGRYVSSDPVVMERTTETMQDDGKIVKRKNYWADAFRDVHFPMKAVKPTILDETGKAMALAIFDEIGIAPQVARHDPMVIGTVNFRKGRDERRVSFLVAWWLSSKDLEI